MEKIRYIDLLLTLRSEYLKLKDNFDGILDDIEVKKPFSNKTISLSKKRKYKSIVYINLKEHRLQLKVEYYDNIKRDNFECIYHIVEDDNKDSALSTYRLEEFEYTLGYKGPKLIESFGSCNIRPIIESDLYKLSWDKNIELEAKHKNFLVACGFPVFKVDDNICPDIWLIRRRLYYNYRDNILEYNTKSGFGLPLSDGSIADPGEKYDGRHNVSTLLEETVDFSLMPDDWKEYILNHLITSDRNALFDDLEYRKKKRRPIKLTNKMADDYKNRLLELKYNNEDGISRYEIRL